MAAARTQSAPQQRSQTWQRVWSYNARPDDGEAEALDESLPPICGCLKQTCVTYKTPIWYAIGLLLILMGMLLFCSACINLSVTTTSSTGINYTIFCGVLFVFAGIFQIFSGGYHTTVVFIMQTVITLGTLVCDIALFILIFIDFYMNAFATKVLLEVGIVLSVPSAEEELETHLFITYVMTGLMVLTLCLITAVYSLFCCISPKYKPDVEVTDQSHHQNSAIQAIPLQSHI